MFHLYENRREAGRKLADALAEYAGQDDIIILALPRGGVPVAYEIAGILNAPLDVLLVRKLGVPGHEEFAMGAIAWGNVQIINRDTVQRLGISKEAIQQVIDRENQELHRRNQLYRNGQPLPQVKGHRVIVVDDGLATGATMKAAVSALRKMGANGIIVAVPVASSDSCRELEKMADKVICPHTPEPFYGVGQWYRDFSQTTDQEVENLLSHAKHTFMGLLKNGESKR